MVKLLCVSPESPSLSTLEKSACEKGINWEYLPVFKTARDKLRQERYDALFMSHLLSLDEQQELAGILWQKNALASTIVFDLEGEPAAQQGEHRLYGIDTAFGAESRSIIEKEFMHLLHIEKAKSPVNADNFRIMVVEDINASLEIICMFVESLGFPLVSGLLSAKKAIHELEKNPGSFDCVITDIQMPEMSGKDLIRFIRGRKDISQIPVIVLTAHGTTDCLLDCLKAGASGFLVKPPKRKDVLRELSRALRIVAKKADSRLAKDGELDLLGEVLSNRR